MKVEQNLTLCGGTHTVKFWSTADPSVVLLPEEEKSVQLDANSQSLMVLYYSVGCWYVAQHLTLYSRLAV